jgi:hypothetical protein
MWPRIEIHGQHAWRAEDDFSMHEGYRMNTWLRICGGLALLSFGVVNIALAMAKGEAMPAATQFEVIFYLVLFVLPGIIELKSGFGRRCWRANALEAGYTIHRAAIVTFRRNGAGGFGVMEPVFERANGHPGGLRMRGFGVAGKSRFGSCCEHMICPGL